MRMTAIRRTLSVLTATAIAGAAAVTLGAAPAHAAATGDLLMKGTGTPYTQNHVVYLGVVPGTTKSFSYKIVNAGGVSQRYEVTTQTFGAGYTARLSKGYTVLPSTYQTDPVAPGGSLVLTLKVTVASGQPQAEYRTLVSLKDPTTHATLDSAYAAAVVTYQAGTTEHDLFLKSGSQPYVGGAVSNQVESSNALKVGQTATFKLRVQNDSSEQADVFLFRDSGVYCPNNFVVRIKDGIRDMTTSVESGEYGVSLAPGGKKDLTVTIKLVTVVNSCTQDFFAFESYGIFTGGVTRVSAHVVTAA